MSTRAKEISSNLSAVKKRIASAAKVSGRDLEDITLIVVTKLFPISDLEILYDLGERNFGENRDQEGAAKSKILPPDIQWHFQGQIQSNKIKSISGWASFIHSLDDLSHARKIDQCVDHSKSVFVQVNLESSPGGDTVRGGVRPDKLGQFLVEVSQLEKLQLVGLMTVAPLQSSPDEIFAQLRGLQQSLYSDFPQLTAISAGMSGDFESAIMHGATHVRIGSSILGHR